MDGEALLAAIAGHCAGSLARKHSKIKIRAHLDRAWLQGAWESAFGRGQRRNETGKDANNRSTPLAANGTGTRPDSRVDVLINQGLRLISRRRATWGSLQIVKFAATACSER